MDIPEPYLVAGQIENDHESTPLGHWGYLKEDTTTNYPLNSTVLLLLKAELPRPPSPLEVVPAPQSNSVVRMVGIVEESSEGKFGAPGCSNYAPPISFSRIR
ncbi:hypothetical protein EVAR_58486_1 [Eumeta japonica]|uniref:Uncharacterized protein n=1 Tax=Eumeta variegata TaxID=151549 RepID=A0A4C1ZL81_EUMVA|nr:hypothetical protein EVAR_58486_1 [Eumeta japonica]